MKKVLISFALFVGVSVSAEAAIQTFSASDTGGSTRTKLNSNFSELDTTKESKAVVQASAPADTNIDWYDTDQESGVLILKRHNGTTWVRASSHGVQYATSCVGITGGMCVDTDDGKLYYHNGTTVVEVGTGSGSGISHATSDGNYYASRNGAWATLTGVFAPPLGPDDNYVTDAEKTAWNAKQDSLVSGTNIKSINGTTLLGSGDLTIEGSMPSWMPSVAPTNGRQILQATGGCTLSAYDNQADCETNTGTWITPTYQHTSIISGLINDTGTADDDLWSAAKIAGDLAGKQATLGFTPENAANKGTANGYAGLGSDGKVPTAQLPTLGTTYDLPSLTDAQAGTSITPYVWSPQRVAQAIAALAPSGGAAASIQMTFASDAALTTAQTGSKTKVPTGMAFTTADVGCDTSDSITFALQKSPTVNGTYTTVGTVSIAGEAQSEGVDISSWPALASGAWVRIDITSAGASATECTIAIGGIEQ